MRCLVPMGQGVSIVDVLGLRLCWLQDLGYSACVFSECVSKP